MSFKSLVNKLVKEGKSREAATKIAGKVANAKMKGAGSGPTAKQKARMKKGSPAKMEDKTKKSPAKMKKQGYNARLDDSLGAKHGKKKQSLKSRRDESEGMEKSMGKRKFSGNKSSAQGKVDKLQARKTKAMIKGKENKARRLDKKQSKAAGLSPAKFNKGLKKASASGKLDNNPKFKAAVDASPAKMAHKKKGSPAKRFQAYDQMDTRNAAQTAGSPMGMYGKHSPANAYGKSPMNMSGQSYDAKEAYNKNLSASARLHYLENNRADAKAKKGGSSISKHMGGRR